MSADKRTPHTDALDTLGTILTTDEKRDAIHLAVDAVIAHEAMQRGSPIGIIKGVAYRAGTYISDDVGDYIKVPYHGIVDPFLTRDVQKGEKFWFVMAPRVVTSLRHVWSHPDFPDE